ncbi:MAG: lysophospholipase L1-like esterase [Rhodothermales bacterium]|jgi:lysophospholipase L1-like esterase
MNVSQWGVEGRAWPDEPRARYFDRLPASAQKQVRGPVWSLSRDSAGMMARFETDATTIWVDYTLLDKGLAMPHMPATGVSGVDLYARDASGKWRWVMVTKPTSQQVRVPIVRGLAPGKREYALYLPLYNGIDQLKIGVAKGAAFQGLTPRQQKPILFYGTSITHGACASRPGLVHTAILGRRFDRPVINIGFSGNGRMEAEVGALLTRVDPAIYVIDCNPNLNATQVRARCIPLVKQLRAARPDTPILLVEDRRNTNSWILPARASYHDANHQALRESYEQLVDEGIKKLFYLPGNDLLGDDSEGATDASHPNDLGFMRQADAFEPVLRKALAQ